MAYLYGHRIHQNPKSTQTFLHIHSTTVFFTTLNVGIISLKMHIKVFNSLFDFFFSSWRLGLPYEALLVQILENAKDSLLNIQVSDQVPVTGYERVDHSIKFNFLNWRWLGTGRTKYPKRNWPQRWLWSYTRSHIFVKNDGSSNEKSECEIWAQNYPFKFLWIVSFKKMLINFKFTFQ